MTSELEWVRHRIVELTHQRLLAGFSPEVRDEYDRLVTRERELLDAERPDT